MGSGIVPAQPRILWRHLAMLLFFLLSALTSLAYGDGSVTGSPSIAPIDDSACALSITSGKSTQANNEAVETESGYETRSAELTKEMTVFNAKISAATSKQTLDNNAQTAILKDPTHPPIPPDLIKDIADDQKKLDDLKASLLKDQKDFKELAEKMPAQKQLVKTTGDTQKSDKAKADAAEAEAQRTGTNAQCRAPGPGGPTLVGKPQDAGVVGGVGAAKSEVAKPEVVKEEKPAAAVENGVEKPNPANPNDELTGTVPEGREEDQQTKVPAEKPLPAKAVAALTPDQPAVPKPDAVISAALDKEARNYLQGFASATQQASDAQTKTDKFRDDVVSTAGRLARYDQLNKIDNEKILAAPGNPNADPNDPIAGPQPEGLEGADKKEFEALAATHAQDEKNLPKLQKAFAAAQDEANKAQANAVALAGSIVALGNNSGGTSPEVQNAIKAVKGWAQASVSDLGQAITEQRLKVMDKSQLDSEEAIIHMNAEANKLQVLQARFEAAKNTGEFLNDPASVITDAQNRLQTQLMLLLAKRENQSGQFLGSADGETKIVFRPVDRLHSLSDNGPPGLNLGSSAAPFPSFTKIGGTGADGKLVFTNQGQNSAVAVIDSQIGAIVEQQRLLSAAAVKFVPEVRFEVAQSALAQLPGQIQNVEKANESFRSEAAQAAAELSKYTGSGQAVDPKETERLQLAATVAQRKVEDSTRTLTALRNSQSVAAIDVATLNPNASADVKASAATIITGNAPKIASGNSELDRLSTARFLNQSSHDQQAAVALNTVAQNQSKAQPNVADLVERKLSVAVEAGADPATALMRAEQAAKFDLAHTQAVVHEDAAKQLALIQERLKTYTDAQTPEMRTILNSKHELFDEQGREVGNAYAAQNARDKLTEQAHLANQSTLEDITGGGGGHKNVTDVRESYKDFLLKGPSTEPVLQTSILLPGHGANLVDATGGFVATTLSTGKTAFDTVKMGAKAVSAFGLEGAAGVAVTAGKVASALNPVTTVITAAQLTRFGVGLYFAPKESDVQSVAQFQNNSITAVSSIQRQLDAYDGDQRSLQAGHLSTQGTTDWRGDSRYGGKVEEAKVDDPSTKLRDKVFSKAADLTLKYVNPGSALVGTLTDEASDIKSAGDTFKDLNNSYKAYNKIVAPVVTFVGGGGESHSTGGTDAGHGAPVVKQALLPAVPSNNDPNSVLVQASAPTIPSGNSDVLPAAQLPAAQLVDTGKGQQVNFQEITDAAGRVSNQWRNGQYNGSGIPDPLTQ